MSYRFLALPLLLLAQVVAAGAEASTLCLPEETSLFSCQTGHKYISLCARPVSDAASNFVQYRYGTKAKIEFKFPERHVAPEQTFRSSWAGGKYGGSQFVSFVVGRDLYVIYDMIDANSGQVRARAGLAILIESEATPKDPISGERPAKSFKKVLQCKHPWTDLKSFPSFGNDVYYDFPRVITSKIFGNRN